MIMKDARLKTFRFLTWIVCVKIINIVLELLSACKKKNTVLLLGDNSIMISSTK